MNIIRMTYEWLRLLVEGDLNPASHAIGKVAALERSDKQYLFQTRMHTTGIPCARPKIILNAEQAITIYRLKPTLTSACSNKRKIRGRSIPIAENYGVSPKTIRDIWNLRTWAKATEQLRIQADNDKHAVHDSRFCSGNKVQQLHHLCSDSMYETMLKRTRIGSTTTRKNYNLRIQLTKKSGNLFSLNGASKCSRNTLLCSLQTSGDC